MCNYNGNNPLELDTFEDLYWSLVDFDSIEWDNCDCLPSTTAACQPPLEQWEIDFDSCDVTAKDAAGGKVDGQDDELCPEEIESCFADLCEDYLCTEDSCDCEKYIISDWTDNDMTKAEFKDFWDAVRSGDL